jgi:hypothetical protein
MLVGTAQLVFITALYIGRIDRPFLAEGGAQIGPDTLDAYPVFSTRHIDTPIPKDLVSCA